MRGDSEKVKCKWATSLHRFGNNKMIIKTDRNWLFNCNFAFSQLEKLESEFIIHSFNRNRDTYSHTNIQSFRSNPFDKKQAEETRNSYHWSWVFFFDSAFEFYTNSIFLISFRVNSMIQHRYEPQIHRHAQTHFSSVLNHFAWYNLLIWWVRVQMQTINNLSYGPCLFAVLRSPFIYNT